MKLAIGFGNRQIVDTGKAILHQTVFGKLPILIAIRAEPIAAIVPLFLGLAHCNAIFGKGPKLLYQTVFDFTDPFPAQQLLGLIPVGYKERSRDCAIMCPAQAIATLAASRVLQPSSAICTI
jgi:hypothetical protein